jgi:hypothetical protein
MTNVCITYICISLYQGMMLLAHICIEVVADIVVLGPR